MMNGYQHLGLDEQRHCSTIYREHETIHQFVYGPDGRSQPGPVAPSACCPSISTATLWA